MKRQRDFTARLVVYGLTKEVSPKYLAKWLRKQADNIEKDPEAYSKTIYNAKLMK